jgi:hypothetical protein
MPAKKKLTSAFIQPDEDWVVRQLRLEALKLAVGTHAGAIEQASAEQVVKTAKVYADFLLGTGTTPEG